jgi:hypothetical protein
MEMSKGYSLCRYPKQTKMSFFSFTKSENKWAKQVMPGMLVLVRGEKLGKGQGKVNIVQILCTHVCKCKNDC